MAYYVAHYEPTKTEAGRHRTHLRDVTVTFTAPDDREAERRVRSFLAKLFIETADDFSTDWRRI